MAKVSEEYSIDIKSNLKDFYNSIQKAETAMDKLTSKKRKLEVDVSNLNQLRDQSRQVQLEINKMTQKKREIKLALDTSDSAKETYRLNSQLDRIDKRVVGLRGEKVRIEADILPINKARSELRGVENDIYKLNNQKVDIKFSDSIKSAGDKISGIGDKMLKSVSPISSKMSNALGIGAAVKGVDALANKITGSVGGAVNRIDTMNNFPKVMGNMNIGADKAKQAIDMLDKGLNGLPTSINDGASAVQNFTSKNTDVLKSTKMFLALNDALLAGGQSGAIQASALEQISQSYAKGKPDMVEWRSLVTAMPAQVKQIAESFHMTDSELGEALRDGSISMDEFFDKIVKLDTEGGGKYKSFADQARNSTDGLQTGWARLNTAITRGTADVITSLDTMLKNIGAGGIGQVFSDIGKAVENSLKYLGTAIENNSGPIKELFDSFSDLGKTIDWQGVFDGFVSGLVDLGKATADAIKFVKPFFEFLGKTPIPGLLAKGLPLYVGAATGLRLFGGATKTVGGTIGILSKLSKVLGPLGGAFLRFGGAVSKIGGIGGKIGGLVSKIPGVSNAVDKLGGLKGKMSGLFGKGGGKETPELPLKKIGVEDLKALGLKLGLLAGLAGTIFIAAKAMEEVSKVNTDGIYEKLAAIGVAVGGMGLINAALSKLGNPLTMVKGLGAIALSAGSLYLCAVALERVATIRGDMTAVYDKLGAMAVAIGGLGVIAVAVGALMNVGGLPLLLSGLGSILLISGTLWAVAAMFDNFANMSFNKDMVKERMDAFIQVFNSMAKFGSKVDFGYIVNTVKAGLVSFINAGVIASFVVIGKELEILSDMKVYEKIVNNRITAIYSVFDSIAKQGSKTDLGTMFNSVKSGLTSIINGGVIGLYIAVSKELELLSSIKLNTPLIYKQIASIHEVFRALEKFGSKSGFGTMFNSIKEGLSSFINGGVIGMYIVVASELSKLQSIKLSQTLIYKQIGMIHSVFGYLEKRGGDSNSFASIKGLLNSFINDKVVDKYIDVAVKLTKLQSIRLNKGAVQNSVKTISGAMKSLTAASSDITGGDIFQNAVGILDAFVNTKLLEKYIEVGKKLNELQSLKVNEDAVQDAVMAVNGTMGLLFELSNELALGDALTNIVGIIDAMVSSNLIDKYIEVASKLNKLQGLQLNEDAVQDAVMAVNGTMGLLFELSNEQSISDAVTNVVAIIDAVVSSALIDKYIEVAKKLNQLQGLELNVDAVEDAVVAVGGAMGLISKMSNEVQGGDVFQNLVAYIDAIVQGSVIDKYVSIGKKLSELQSIELNQEAVESSIMAVNESMNLLSELANELDVEGTIQNVVGLVDAFIQNLVIDKIVAIGSKLQTLQGMELNQEAISAGMNAVISAMHSISSLSDGIDGEDIFESVIQLVDSFAQSFIVDKIIDIGNKLNQLVGLNLNAEAISSSIKTVMDSLKKIGGISEDGNIFQQIGSVWSNLLGTADNASAAEQVGQIVAIGEQLKRVEALELNGEKINTQISTVKNALKSLDGTEGGNIVNNLNGISSALERMVNQITNKYPGEFSNLGKLLAENMSNKFASTLDFQKGVNDSMRKINTTMGGSYGTKLAQGLNDAFRSALSIGQAVENAINGALGKNYSTNITVNAVKGTSNLPRSIFASGGHVTGSHAQYSLADSPEHPVLNNGEYVVPKHAVRKLGVAFLNRLSRHDTVSPTFNAMSQGVSNMTSTIVNNTYHNNNDNRIDNTRITNHYGNNGGALLLDGGAGLR